MKVKDSNGVVIQNMQRGPNGALFIKDDNALNTHRSEYKRAVEVVELKKQVAQMQELIQKLLNK